MEEKTFSIFFLIFLIIVYLIFGALTFQHLELENEKETQAQYFELFVNLKVKYNISGVMLQDFWLTHEKACELGVPTNLEHDKWSFSGSFYFVGTVLTTIGYGHTAPSTMAGRIIFIIYALTSIPLNMLLLNMVLEVSVTYLTHVYQRICDRFKRQQANGQCPNKNHLQSTSEINIRGVLILITVIFITIATVTATMFMYIEEWSYFEGFYFTIVSFTTVGLGDYVPFKTASKHNKYEVYQLLNLFVIMIGSIFTYILLNLLATIYKNFIHLVSCYTVIARQETKNVEAASRNVPIRKENPSASFRNPSASFRNPSASFRSTVSTPENNPMGSFAAIQRAIDKIRTKVEDDNSMKINELKAVNTIEAILQEEYKKIQVRRGDDPTSRWQRAAAKARLINRRKSSTVYKSVLMDAALGTSNSGIGGFALETPPPTSDLRRKLTRKAISDLSTKSLQDALLRRGSFNLQSLKESRLSVQHEQDSTSSPYTLHDILERSLNKPISRKTTQSTYLPSDLDKESSALTSAESTPINLRKNCPKNYSVPRKINENLDSLNYQTMLNNLKKDSIRRRPSTYFSPVSTEFTDRQNTRHIRDRTSSGDESEYADENYDTLRHHFRVSNQREHNGATAATSKVPTSIIFEQTYEDTRIKYV